jgi:hypothetical protein
VGKIVELIEKYSRIIQSLLTSLAIVVGGIWTYNEFIRERTDIARLNINHEIRTLLIPGIRDGYMCVFI